MQDDGPLKITIYHVTWLPSRNKAITYLLTIIADIIDCNAIMRRDRKPILNAPSNKSRYNL